MAAANASLGDLRTWTHHVNGKGRGRKESCPNWSHQPIICLKVLRKITKTLTVGFLGKDVYSGPPEYEVAKLPFWSFSVNSTWVLWSSMLLFLTCSFVPSVSMHNVSTTSVHCVHAWKLLTWPQVLVLCCHCSSIKDDWYLHCHCNCLPGWINRCTS